MVALIVEIFKAILYYAIFAKCEIMPFNRVPDEQCHDLCVQKHGNNGPSVLLVPKNNTKSTKSSLEGFSWDATIGKMQESPGPLVCLISFMQ